MATGTLSVSITIPVTAAADPNLAGRGIAVMALNAVEEVVGSNSQTSGNIIYPPGSTTVIGTWSFTAGT